MSSSEIATTPAQPAVKATSPKDGSQKVQSRSKRAPRRRRARGGFESDEEIVRAIDTSESEDDDDDHSSSSDSATDDSDTEPGSEDVPSNIQTPAVSKAVEGVPHINGAVAPFFETSLAWSEMVADEHENGAAGLPVIEFAEFDETAKIPARPTKKSRKQKHKKTARSTSPAPPAQEPEAVEEEPEDRLSPEHPERSGSQPPPRRFGQTARQVYQERLEKDPSYVPKVGGFWGHDDRLMDKDLRSLSGWWRGQWQGRGRGRGFGGRGGGRGGHAAHNSVEANPEELPPVERAWTHDGFEEMKKREEDRQARQDGMRGRGAIRGARGGVAGRGRGTFKPHPIPRPGLPTPAAQRSKIVLKPENVQSQLTPAALFYEPKSKSRVRVKVPGKQPRVVKLETGTALTKPASDSTEAPKPTNLPQLQYIIRIPKPKDEQPLAPEPPTEPEPVAQQPPATGPVLSTVPEVPPGLGIKAPLSISQAPPDDTCSSQPSPAVVTQLEQLSIEPTSTDPGRQALTEEAVLRGRGEAPETSPADMRPTLPPLQTVFTPPPPPVSQPSPVYGSPYGFPHAPLPPGIAINHHGMPYEMATGRPVYLQAPPPPPMYNPQPIMPPHHYGHVRHPSSISMSSMSPDFLAQPPSHTPPTNPMNGFIDPATGTPIFSFPRPNARVEIRAPDASEAHRSPPNGKAIVANRGPSKLRTTATVFEPSRPIPTQPTNGEGYYPSIGTPDGTAMPPSYEAVNGAQPEVIPGQQPPPQMAPQMVPYNPYAQQQYYYPEAYGYSQYMEVPPHHGQYEGYVDQGQQQAAYY